MKTLSFEEWLLFRNLNVLLEELKRIREREDYFSLSHRELLSQFNEFLVFGGYAEIARKFSENYPGYPLKIISYETGTDCRWILKI